MKIGKVLNPKTGLVLEGGGLRAIYTAGVLDVFGEQGLSFDAIVAVSAGAIHATSFLSQQHGRSVRFYLAYSKDWRFFSLRSLLLTGSLVGTRFCYDTIPNSLVPFDHQAFDANPTRFYVTCTDLMTGQPVYPEVESLRYDALGMRLVRASASMPLVSRIVKHKGLRLLDGGTSDAIPVDFCRSLGCSKTVVILTQTKAYQKKPEINRLIQWRYRNYPNYLDTIAKRHEQYNQRRQAIEALNAAGEIFAIWPSRQIKISRFEHDPTKILQMYELGRHDALAHFDALKAYLGPEASA